jgi:hypothetical protein
MSRRFALAAALLFAVACERRPVTDELTLNFSKDDQTVIVTAVSLLDTDAARDAALAGTDAWAARFARLNAENERITFEKKHGTIEQVTRSMRIPRADLQRVFSDANITVDLTGGEGWSELRFYPGSGSRASRAQQAHFDDALEAWSEDAARYFAAVHRLYGYMDANPDRVRDLWAAVLYEENRPVLFEEEEPYVDEVVRTMDEMGTRMDEERRHAMRYATEADLIFNPFPARIVVQVEGDVLGKEGFGEKLAIEPADLLEAVSSLEGRWISPDPFVALAREETAPTSEAFSIRRRTSAAVVRPSEIRDALRERLARRATYAVRWRD